LAIELAALRLTHMTIGDLHAQIDDPHMLALLAGNTIDVPERHASLERAIGWSFERLSDDERLIAVRLCRFKTRFRPADAAHMASDDTISHERVTAIVHHLVNCSLLLKQEDRNLRAVYQWPTPVRQFGLNALQISADSARTNDRYAALC